MRWIPVLVALLGLVAHPAMAAELGEKGAKELTTEQKQSQETPAATQPQEGSMAVVPAGEFMMGSRTGDADEQPAHKVYVDAFSMDKYEVTVGQYAAFLQAKGIDPPSDWKTMNHPAQQKRPVANVDWADAASYCNWAGKRRKRRSGRRQPRGRMAASIRGATILRRRSTRTMGKGSGTTMEHWRRWGRWKRARVPMASMTWPAMSRNGSATGMTMAITRPARRRTRQDRHQANPKCCGVARGAAILSSCGLRSGTSTDRRTGTRTTGSGARGLRSFWLLDSWFVALRPKGAGSASPWWDRAIRAA